MAVLNRAPARRPAVRCLLIPFCLPLPQPDAGSAAVLGDEVHAGPLKRAHDGGEGLGIAGITAGFNIGHGIAVNAGGLGKVAHAPV